MTEATEKPEPVYVPEVDWRALGYRTRTDYDADIWRLDARYQTKPAPEAEKPENDKEDAA